MTAQAPEPSTNKLKAIFASLWVRLPVAVAIGLGTAWITGWQYAHLSPDPTVPPSLPYACPIAGDCKLPGDDRRKGDKPQSEISSSGNDRILPPDDKADAKP